MIVAGVSDQASTATPPFIPFALLVVALLVLLIAGGFGLAMWRRRWLMADLPTSEAAHVFVGMNEVLGTAQPEGQPLVAPYSATECVWYRSVLEREVQSGNDQKRWRTEHDEQSEAPFWIEDRTGRVLIRPKGASVDAPQRHRQTHGGKPQRFGRLSLLVSLDGGSLSLGSTSMDNHRTTEWYLQPGDPIYLLGEATLRDDVVALEFAPSDPRSGVKQRPLLVSHGDERTAARRTGVIAALLLLVSLAAAAGIPAAFHAFTTAKNDGPLPGAPSMLESTGPAMVVADGLVVAVLAFLFVGRVFNRLVSVRNRAQVAWSLIDIHLRRRHDLLPALAATVAGAAAHERTVQETAARLRTQATVPEQPGLPDAAALARTEAVDATDRAETAALLALAEAYPDLQTIENHAKLVEQITHAEDGIAFARGFYNDAITVLRDRRQRFPGILLAPLVPVPSLELWADGPPVDVGQVDQSGPKG